MYLPFECDFCVLNFAVRSDRNTHLMRHFKQRCCTNCDKSLLQIGDNWYELRLHFDKNCNIVDEDRSSAYGQKVFKTEDSTAYPNEEWLTPIQEFKEFSENRFTTQTNDTVIDVKSEIPEYDVLNVDTLLPEASDKIATKSDEFGNDDARHSNQSQQYECETCQKRFNYISSLRRHLRKGHDKADRFKCEICKKGFCDQNELKIHARNMHDGQRYTCEFCNRNFKKKYRLNVHKTVHTTEHQVTCDICQKQFRHKAFLVKHMRIHVDKKKFSCEICSKEFASVKIAKSHKRIVHEKKAVHKCNVCDKVSATSTNLKVHMNSHLDNRPFVCNYCGKSFKQKVHMMEHINGHTGERPYACSYCNKTYAARSHLHAHTRLHTGIRPFKCTVDGCVRAFPNGTDLKRHRYTVHRIYTKKHVCPICSKFYPENKYLKRHLECHKALDSQSLF